MCDIRNKTDLSKITVYKLVKTDIQNNYYAFYSGLPIQLGKIELDWDGSKIERTFFDQYDFQDFIHSFLFNGFMNGKMSGFATLEMAKKLLSKTVYGGDNKTILKIELGGEIWKGTSKNISIYIPDDGIIYAGTEVLSFKEISIKNEK